ncbi:MAG: ribonuclease H family protein [Gudongella sp.]|nr:ribonuclease H family protein [Gudongella sp.]
MKKFFYSVKQGRNPGIYTNWEEAKAQVIGFSGAVYKKFERIEDAKEFLEGNLKNNPIDEIEDKAELIAYVDGSYDLESGSYSYGVVIIGNDFKETLSGREQNPEMASMRNVAGEIKGAMCAMKWAVDHNKKNLYIYYDYTGIENWAKGNWKANKKGTQEYREYYNSIKDRLNVEFRKVKAHSGDQYNDEADKLAKDAI